LEEKFVINDFLEILFNLENQSLENQRFSNIEKSKILQRLENKI